jgi:hypothetical protein
VRLLLAILLSVAGTAHAKPTWHDLEAGQGYLLDRQLVWPNGFRLELGLTVEITEIVPLDAINVLLVNARAPGCADAERSAGMEIFAVPAEVGILVTPGCEISFFLEFIDLYTTAPLE